jgi:hypothetical protein
LHASHIDTNTLQASNNQQQKEAEEYILVQKEMNIIEKIFSFLVCKTSLEHTDLPQFFFF